MFLVLMKSRLFLGKWQNEFTSMDNGECDHANSFTIIGRVFDLRLWIVNS